MSTAWAEDRALLKSNSSADSGAETEVRAALETAPPVLHFGIGAQSEKLSRHDAETLRQEVAIDSLAPSGQISSSR